VGAPRLILLASSFNRYDQYAVNRIDDRIELWTYTLYDADLLSVDLLSSEEVPSSQPNAVPTRRGPRKPRLDRPEPPTTAKDTYDIEHHLSKMSPTTQALFELLKEGIVDLGDNVTERFMNQYVGYRRLKNFCEVVGQRRKLNVFIDGPIVDKYGIGVDMTNTGHWGTGDLRVEVSSEDDIAPVLDLIGQAYALQE
jgi:predicted transport protein